MARKKPKKRTAIVSQYAIEVIGQKRMAVTVTQNLTTMADGDAISPSTPVAGTWTPSQGSLAADTAIYREATASLTAEIRTAGVQYITFTRSTGTWDLTDTHIYAWLNYLFPADLYNLANGGIRIRVGDGANTGDWKVGGSDTYFGGWNCFVAYTGNAFDYNSGTDPNISAITEVGFAVNIQNSGKNVESMFVDVIRYGDGLTITSDSTCTFEDIYTAAEATTSGAASGIIRKDAGVYYVKGKLRFGNASSGSITFEDTSNTIVFEDLPVSADLYEILIQGNAGGTTSVKFGTKSGSRGVSGFTFLSEGTKKFDVTATDDDIDTLGFYGCTFLDADSIQLPTYTSTREMLSCNVEASGEVKVSTCTVQYCNFINADDNGIEISNTGHKVTYSNFINCVDGVEITLSGTYTFNNLQFAGCTYDVEFSAITGWLTINAESSNPSTYRITGSGGGVTINNAVPVSIHVIDQNGTDIQNAQTAIYNVSGYTQLLNADTDVDGLAGYSHNYVGDTDIEIRVRKSSTGTTRYYPFKGTGTIDDNGFTLNVRLSEDTIATT